MNSREVLCLGGRLRRIHRELLTAIISIPLLLPFASLHAAALPPSGPLVVDENRHVVVMEYEAWFGPNAVNFQTSAAMPLLQSKDMQAVGGGYDSAKPRII